MLTTKEHAPVEHDHKTPEFREPEAWLGHAPKTQVRVCFAATNPKAWEVGTEAVVSYEGRRFRIVCEGEDVPLMQTTRGILVSE